MAKLNVEAQTENTSKYLKGSDQIGFDDGHIAIHAPKGHGKTVLAATASAFCPPELAQGLPAKKRAELKDMLWVAFDRAAVAGFQELNLTLPAGHYIDADAIMGDLGIGKGVATIVKLAQDAVESNSLRHVVIDTVSKFDKILTGHYSRIYEGESNTFQMYRDVFNYHKRLYDGLNFTGAQLIELFHSRATPDPTSKQMGDTQKAQKVAGAESIGIDVTGQARTVYLGDCVLQLVILASVEVGSKDKTKMKRVALPFGGRGFDGGSRFTQALDSEEPPHLGLIRKKIQAYKA